MNAMMFAEGLLSKQQVIEEFGIPQQLESRLFAILKPRVGKLYWKEEVKSAMEKVLGVGNRPPTAAYESYSNEDPMIAMNQELEPWVRIADSLEQLLGVFLPKTPSADINPSDAVYTTAQVAKLLHRHVDVVREYCRQGVFGTRDAGGQWGIRHSEVERFRTGQLLVRGRGGA